MVSSQRQEPGAMPSSPQPLNELAVLMELRLAFGPGTRLWSLRSREEICYDWLRFKARQGSASFRDFALGLYSAEKTHSLPCVSLHEIRRRVASVLRAYRIKKRASVSRAAPSQPPRTESPGVQTSPSRPSMTAAQVLPSPSVFNGLNGFPLRSSEMPR